MSESSNPPPAAASLYARLGGYDAIYVFAARALQKAMAHPDIGHIWAHMSESTFQKEHINFVDFLSRQWGGNARYRGRDMVTAHRGMGLTEVHWRAMFDCLHACYAEFGLPAELQAEINATFERYKPAVVGSPSYRDVVLAHPEMDVTRGMGSVGMVWPAHGTPPIAGEPPGSGPAAD
ncbi:MAG: group I truncated hemoglobin [Nevskia sp.]|uniref:group I truncated hemoglobin n=1 Tax=Nevskia sp. TaxID=1929292 RepID=UPI004035FDA0